MTEARPAHPWMGASAPGVLEGMLAEIGAPSDTWDAALADESTHADVRADHDEAVARYGGFGVPIIVFPSGRAVYGPVVVPAPSGDEALALWDLTEPRAPGAAAAHAAVVPQ